ncbi:MAG: glycosyltransferase [Thermoanaerobaculia bacterium]
MAEREQPPRLSVVVFLRQVPETISETLSSLARQELFENTEVILADGSPEGAGEALRESFPWVRLLSLTPGKTSRRSPSGAMPFLKGEAIRAARAEVVAILDPLDAAEPGWIRELLDGLADESVAAVGGAVILDGPATAANRAAYLFEYGAFNPPIEAGCTDGDLPGNNVAYRRRLLVEDCGDILDREGFNKPFVHQRIRERQGKLVLRAGMRVRHLSRHRFLPFAVRRFHYGRCFGAVRWRRSPFRQRLLYGLGAPAVPAWLMVRHLLRSFRHPVNRRYLLHAAPALLGICLFWGLGEWIGYWFGAGRSCERLY